MQDSDKKLNNNKELGTLEMGILYSKMPESIKKEIIEEKGKFLTENLEVIINFYDENALSVNLPNQIQCKIDSTDVALKGQTVSSSYKPAVLNNGLKIQVPPFIESGDIILVDTRTIEYVKRI